MRVFSVYDQAAKVFMPPFCCRTDGEASRSFTMALRDPKHTFAMAPADYTLFYIGEFNELTGKLDACVPSQLIMKGSAAAEQHSEATRS